MFNTHTKEIDFLIDCAKNASKIIDSETMQVNQKGTGGDLVTNLDYAVEDYIIDRIKKEFPSFSIVSEEYNTNNSLTENCFVIDPIDGTVNFAHNLPHWSIQIACVKNGELVASVIYAPRLNQLYSAVKGEGAYMNGKRIHVNALPSNKNLFSLDGDSKQRTRFMLADELSKKIPLFRRTGAISISLAFLSYGAYGLVPYLSYSLWDFMPGKLLCEEAGGITHTENESWFVAACSQEILDVALPIIRKHYIPE